MCGGQNLSKYYYNQLKSMIDNDVEELKKLISKNTKDIADLQYLCNHTGETY